jgi:serine protease AprX
MKTKHLLLSILLLFGIAANAQTAEERAKNVDSISKLKAEQLKSTFQNRFNDAEKKVKDYLKKNPKIKRSFEKNGSMYYLHHIDSSGKPVYINTKNRESATLMKADQLYRGGSMGVNITGDSMVVGVWDGGAVRETHELLSGNVTMQPNQTLDGIGAKKTYAGNNHMTHVSGTMVGKNMPNKPRGVAYGAKAWCYDWSSDLQEMAEFGSKGYLISNHSYGYLNDTTTATWTFGAYDETAKNWDLLTRYLPNYLPFVAVGNEQEDSGNRKAKLGYDVITGSSASKNVMTVGAVNGDKAMSDYSNWGPTDDGRVKPDIVAKGTGINSSLFADKTSKTPSDTAYSGVVNSQGTSYATPAAAAAGLLLQQYYHSLYKTYMKSSTLKALMLGTAEDLGQPGPDPKFGWGLLDIEKAANTIKYKSIIGNTVKPILLDTTKKTVVLDSVAQKKALALADSLLKKSYVVKDTASRGAYIEEMAFKFPADTLTEISREVTASGCSPLIVSIAWTDIEGVEQTIKDSIDPQVSRLIYDYDMVVKNVTKDSTHRAWKPVGMANRTANATHETKWFDGNGNNYRQVKIDSAKKGEKYKIIFRKSKTSPDSARLLSLVVTGTLMRDLAKPVADTIQYFCSTSTIADLVATGTNIKWYDSLKVGKVYADTIKLVETKTYYASQTVFGCESPRAAVTIKNVTTLEAPVALETKVKTGSAVTLTATCKAGTPNWYATATGGMSLNSGNFRTPKLTADTSYYVACESGRNANCVSVRTLQMVKIDTAKAIVKGRIIAINDASKPVQKEANARIASEGTDSEEVFIDVFPNPTTGLCYWKVLSNEPSALSLTMYNSMGREQLSQSSPSVTQTHEGTLDLANINTGTYFLKFDVGAKSIVRKIVKQ